VEKLDLSDNRTAYDIGSAAYNALLLSLVHE